MVEELLRKKIGKQLIALINKNASLLQISQWADQIYSDHCRELDTDVEDIITKISFMQHGSEFEMDKLELEKLAKKLIEIKQEGSR